MTEPATLFLAACGDILLHGRYHDRARDPGAAAVFAPLASALADCDLGIANMETVLSIGGTPRDDKLCLAGDPSYAAALAGAGLTLMTLANNHCLDFGPEGLAETCRHLDAAGIGHLGAGTDLAEASRPLVVERQGLRLGFIAACHASTKPGPAATSKSAGLAPFDEPALLAAIAALKPQVDHVILIPHWGLEYSRYPTPEQVSFAHAAIDAGASAVLGHHSHCIQGIEEYAGGVIAYSLANLTDAPVDWQGPSRHYQCDIKTVDRESILLKLRIDRERVAVAEVLPLWLDDAGRPTLATGERAADPPDPGGCLRPPARRRPPGVLGGHPDREARRRALSATGGTRATCGTRCAASVLGNS